MSGDWTCFSDSYSTMWLWQYTNNYNKISPVKTKECENWFKYWNSLALCSSDAVLPLGARDMYPIDRPCIFHNIETKTTNFVPSYMRPAFDLHDLYSYIFFLIQEGTMRARCTWPIFSSAYLHSRPMHYYHHLNELVFVLNDPGLVCHYLAEYLTESTRQYWSSFLST